MADLSEPPPKRIRKGTKSCIECRTRKIRCIWEAETDQVCASCKTRRRQCVPQTYPRRSHPSDTLRADRIGRLEREVEKLVAAVQEKGNGRSGSLASSTDLSPAIEDVVESHPLEGPATTPPTHLKFLFDNSLIAPSNQGGEIEQVSRPPCSQKYLEQARAKLQSLMPSKQDVQNTAGYGTAWMLLHQSLFTSELQFGSKDALIDQYDDQNSPNARPVDIASFLLVFAITVRQVPADEENMTLRDVPKYVKDVLHVVETTIVSHPGIASTLEGLSTTVLYMRLQLGVGQIRPLWLTLRRTIAIAELIGLPRAWNSNHFENQRTNAKQTVRDPRITEKVALWEAICAIDRLASMTFNLPAATATYFFPKRDIVSSTGEVMSQPYLLELAAIAMRVQELDESHTFGRSEPEIYEKVLCIDKDIRSLKSSTPSSWWIEDAADFSGHCLVQFWHFYLLYGYSRTVCAESCQILAHRYGHVRRNLPPGFFVCRIIDIQVFTAAIFLALSYGKAVARNDHGFGPKISQEEQQLAAVHAILKTMDCVSGQLSSDFAQEAASAIRSLLNLAERPAAASSQGLTLRIPLLGKIHITAKKQVQVPPQLSPDLHRQSLLHDAEADTRNEADNIHHGFHTPPHTIPWYMELDMDSSSLQDPYITNEIGDWDQWMGAGGINFFT